MNIESLSDYLTLDYEKHDMIGSHFHIDAQGLCLRQEVLEPTKYCPKCFKKYMEYENTCFDCLVRLKHINEMKNVRDIVFKPEFKVSGREFDDFSKIFLDENKRKIRDFNFTIRDYEKIITNIKKTALENLDMISRENEINIDLLDIQNKVLLFVKSFVGVSFKSNGQQLGYFEFKRIYADDRLKNSLLVTTLIHELSHFLLNEIFTQILCYILDCAKNSYIEAISTFILSYSSMSCLIDEYSAHNVEGRFTVFGYQDYSSFIQILKSLDGEMDSDEIEIIKSIANTFSLSIKDVLESFIDDELREDIKDQFLDENTDGANYEMLKLENSNILTDEGFIKAIGMVLVEGFETAGLNVLKLEEYNSKFN